MKPILPEPFTELVQPPNCIRLLLSIWVFPKIGVPPKSSILIGFSIINHPFWGTTIFGNIHMVHAPQQVLSVSVPKKTTANTSHRCWFQVGAYLRDLKFPPFIMPLLQLEMGRTQISNSLLVEVLSIAPRKNLCHSETRQEFMAET